ncbi:hypothetical protein HYT52_04230 [Candidatus Woesearchaeota archaeon]|nr:hypothetical protein [Candidatus Woesearchaeota archaeon]
MPKQRKKEYRFLIIYDEFNSTNLEDTTSLLWSNVQVRREETNEGAFEALRSGSYDVIFYDLGMESGVWGGAIIPKLIESGKVLLRQF